MAPKRRASKKKKPAAAKKKPVEVPDDSGECSGECTDTVDEDELVDNTYWPPEIEEKLIDLWEYEASLYDMSVTGYKKRAKKEVTLARFSKILGMSVSAVETRLRNLRTAYTKGKQRLRSGSGAENMTARQAFIQRRIAFIEPHVKIKETTNSFEEEPMATQNPKTDPKDKEKDPKDKEKDPEDKEKDPKEKEKEKENETDKAPAQIKDPASTMETEAANVLANIAAHVAADHSEDHIVKETGKEAEEPQDPEGTKEGGAAKGKEDQNVNVDPKVPEKKASKAKPKTQSSKSKEPKFQFRPPVKNVPTPQYQEVFDIQEHDDGKVESSSTDDEAGPLSKRQRASSPTTAGPVEDVIVTAGASASTKKGLLSPSETDEQHREKVQQVQAKDKTLTLRKKGPSKVTKPTLQAMFQERSEILNKMSDSISNPTPIEVVVPPQAPVAEKSYTEDEAWCLLLAKKLPRMKEEVKDDFKIFVDGTAVQAIRGKWPTTSANPSPRKIHFSPRTSPQVFTVPAVPQLPMVANFQQMTPATVVQESQFTSTPIAATVAANTTTCNTGNVTASTSSIPKDNFLSAAVARLPPMMTPQPQQVTQQALAQQQIQLPIGEAVMYSYDYVPQY